MFLVIVTYFLVVVVADVVEFNLYSRPRIQRPQENKTKYLFGYVWLPVCVYVCVPARCYGRVSAHLFTFFNEHTEYTNNKFYFTSKGTNFN